MVALLVGVFNLSPLAIVSVNRGGLGIEHEQGWRRPRAVVTACLSSAASAVRRIGQALETMQRSAWFLPATGAAALVLAAVAPELGLGAALVMGTTLTSANPTAGFLAGERADMGSRGRATVLSGQTFLAGEVFGRANRGIGRVSIPSVAGTGNGTVSAVFAGPDVEVGSYVLNLETAVANGGVWSLTTPSGKLLPALTMTVGAGASTVYRSRHLNFTITDGSTDFSGTTTFTFVVDSTAPTVIGGTGTGVMTALSLGPDAMPGNYRVINRVVITNGGDFEVIAPNGMSIGRFNWAASSSTAAFSSTHINFTLSDATDYIAGNYFDVCVYNELAGGKAVQWDPLTYDGRHRVAGISLAAVDASLADVVAATIVRDASVLKTALAWGTAISAAEKESAYAELEALGIIAA